MTIGVIGLAVLCVILSVIESISIALTLGHMTAGEVVALVAERIYRVVPIPSVPIPTARIDEDSAVSSTSVPIESPPALSLRG
jgi:hypothetical protein